MGRYKFRPTYDPQKRFLEKVDKNGPIPIHKPELGQCWNWLGAKRKHGHGYFFVERKATTPYRYSYIFHKGDFDQSLSVLHKCDNGACVNPEHLFVGTQLDNMGDAKEKGRVQCGEQRFNASITADEVLEIRKLYSEGMRIMHIMTAMGCSRKVVSRVVHGTGWTHVK